MSGTPGRDTELEDQALQADAQIARLSQSRADLEQQLAAVTGDRDRLRELLDEIHAERDGLTDRIAGLVTELNAVTAERNRLREQLAAAWRHNAIITGHDREPYEPLPKRITGAGLEHLLKLYPDGPPWHPVPHNPEGR